MDLGILTGMFALAGLVGAAPPAWVYARFLAYHRHKGVDVGLDPLAMSQRLAYEARAYLRLASWYPLLPLEEGWRWQPEATGRPVLAVHGFTQNATNFVAIRRALELGGRPTGAVSLGLPGRRVRAYAPRLVRSLEEALERSPDGIDVIAHSMGGLVLRVALNDRPDLAKAVRTVVTLGSPHKGTAMTRGLATFLPEAFDLHRRSAFNRDLPGLRDLAPHLALTTFAGDFDAIVYPRETCHVEGAVNIDLPVGHAGLLVHPASIAQVADAILGAAKPV
jgi:triacylglycerol lipase